MSATPTPPTITGVTFSNWRLDWQYVGSSLTEIWVADATFTATIASWVSDPTFNYATYAARDSLWGLAFGTLTGDTDALRTTRVDTGYNSKVIRKIRPGDYTVRAKSYHVHWLGSDSSPGQGNEIIFTPATSPYAFTVPAYTPPTPPAPTISSASSASGTVGVAFVFNVTSTSFVSFGASGLPAGLAIDPASGAITGIPRNTGVSTVTLSVTDANGTGTQTFTLTVAAPVTPSDITTSGSGSSTVVSGTAGAGVEIQVFDNGSLVGSIFADTNGAWSWGANGLSSGSHAITFKAISSNGVASAATAATTVVIPAVTVVAPTAPASAPAITVSGTSVTVGATSPVGSIITVYDGPYVVKVLTAPSPSGTWSTTLDNLGPGAHLISYTVTENGYTSPKSPAASAGIVADTTAPALGSPSYDDNPFTPTFSDTTEPFATVLIYDNGVLIGTTTANSSGAWSATLGLDTGSHSITFALKDPSGNTSATFPSPAIAIDTPTRSGLAIAAPTTRPASGVSTAAADGSTMFVVLREPGSTNTSGELMPVSEIGDRARYWGAKYNQSIRTLAQRIYSAERILGATGMAKGSNDPALPATFVSDAGDLALVEGFKKADGSAHPQRPVSGTSVKNQVFKSIQYLAYLSNYARTQIADLNTRVGTEQIAATYAKLSTLNSSIVTALNAASPNQITPRMLQFKSQTGGPNITWGSDYNPIDTYEGTFISNTGATMELWTSTKTSYTAAALYNQSTRSWTHATRFNSGVVVSTESGYSAVPWSVITTIRGLKVV